MLFRVQIPISLRIPPQPGGAKFAGYEFWKKTFVQIAGDQDSAVKYRTAIYLGAASVAE
jgi:solute carrier family 25 phosphate transporter 3